MFLRKILGFLTACRYDREIKKARKIHFDKRPSPIEDIHIAEMNFNAGFYYAYFGERIGKILEGK